jgi:4-hydroxybenzoate polyprenyltransferase
MRIYQWVKNVLLFLPLVLAHKANNLDAIWTVLLAFFAFGLSASFVYVTNDLFDLDSDRTHPNKRRRPLASGALSIKQAFVLMPILPILSFCISLYFLPIEFTLALISYMIITFAYSLALKRIYILDVIVLSCLYTLRIIAGSLASDVPVSPWMLEFSVFLFTSLAFVKRYTELLIMKEKNHTKTKGRGYNVGDIDMIRSIGPISGYLSILVFTLYLNSPEVARLYHNPTMMWPVSVCFIFWITRIWFLAHRGEMTDDPIVFTVKDPISYIVGIIAIALVIGATL